MKQKEVEKTFSFCVKEAYVLHVPMFPTPSPSWDPSLFSMPAARLLFCLINIHGGTLAKYILFNTKYTIFSVIEIIRQFLSNLNHQK